MDVKEASTRTVSLGDIVLMMPNSSSERAAIVTRVHATVLKPSVDLAIFGNGDVLFRSGVPFSPEAKEGHWRFKPEV